MARSATLLLLAPALLSGAQTQQAASPEDLVRNGLAAQQHGDLKTAIDDFRRALSMRPNLLDAEVGLSSALVAAGDLDGAIALDQDALQATPDNADLRRNLGIAYYKKGDLGRARRELDTVRRAHPDDIAATVMLGYTFNKLGREADTVALLEPLEAAHASNLDLEYGLGYAMIATGRAAEGIARVEKVAAARQTPDAWMLAGTARFEQNQFREALADAQGALKIDPAYPGAHTLAGQALYARHEADAAMAEFRAALRQNASDFTANLYLGILRLDKHDAASARPFIELALSIHPQDPLTRREMARVCSMEGKIEEAVTILEGLERSDPEWLTPHLDLTVLYYKLHRPEDGRREQEILEKLQAAQAKQGQEKK